MAARLTNFACLWQASPTCEPEPNRRSPGQGRVGGHPAGVVQQEALVSTELLAELPIVVVPRQLLWTSPFVLTPRLAWVHRVGRAISSTHLLHEAEAPGGAATTVAIAPHRATRARSIAQFARLATASTSGLLGHLAQPSRKLPLVISHAGALREVWVHERRLDEAFVCKHLAAVALRITDVREHLVEELLREPARDSSTRLEITSVRCWCRCANARLGQRRRRW